VERQASCVAKVVSQCLSRGILDVLRRQIQEALRRYVAVESWQVGQILEGIRAADAGDFASEEEVEAVSSKYDTRAS